MNTAWDLGEMGDDADIIDAVQADEGDKEQQLDDY